MYKVIGTRRSRAFRVLWMLEEMGQPYEHVASTPRSPEATEVNPTGKIPALVTGDTVLTDSTAIMIHLGDVHGAFCHTAGTLERARQEGWTHRLMDELDAVLWVASRHSYVLPEDQRVPDIIPTQKQEYTRNLSRISGSVVGPFVMGDEMRIPDIILTHCLRWAALIGFPEPDEKLAAYLARMESRPALKRAADLA